MRPAISKRKIWVGCSIVALIVIAYIYALPPYNKDLDYSNVLLINEIKFIECGFDNSAIISEDGQLWVWGNNEYGQLGLGYVSNFESSPVRNPLLSNVCLIRMTKSTSFVILSDGTVWGFGSCMDSILSLYCDKTYSAVPVKIEGLVSVSEIAVCGNSALAITTDGTMVALGEHSSSGLGIGALEADMDPTPRRFELLNNFKSVALGNNHALAIDRNGFVWGWGNNHLSRYSRNLRIPQGGSIFPKPEIIDDNNNKMICKVFAGSAHSIFLGNNGTVYATGGMSEDGELGYILHDGFSGKPQPVTSGDKLEWGVVTLSEPICDIDISLWNAYSVAVDINGNVWEWGTIRCGPDGFPIKREDVHHITSVAVGHNFGLALDTTNTIWAWGVNKKGQLGTGDKAEHTVAVPIMKGDGGSH